MKIETIDGIKVRKRNWGYRFFKRFFDIIISGFLILAFSWLLLILYILSMITSRGAGVFKDTRMGRHFQRFHVYKFRTMYRDAETNPDKYLSRKQKKEWRLERKLDYDPRVTPFGRFLRKASLDELPQLFNVLMGTMSFVGPRPITEEELKHFFTVPEQKVLLSVRPGLISLWGVKGRSQVDFSSGQRQKLEIEYFEHRGFRYDVGLIFRAVPAVLSGKGAK